MIVRTVVHTIWSAVRIGVCIGSPAPANSGGDFIPIAWAIIYTIRSSIGIRVCIRDTASTCAWRSCTRIADSAPKRVCTPRRRARCFRSRRRRGGSWSSADSRGRELNDGKFVSCWWIAGRARVPPSRRAPTTFPAQRAAPHRRDRREWPGAPSAARPH